MEGQENVSTTAAPSSVAREGLLVLPTPEHVGLHQSQPAAGAQQQTVETQIPASAVGPVSRVGLPTKAHSNPSLLRSFTLSFKQNIKLTVHNYVVRII
jgi:hypothetical protein